MASRDKKGQEGREQPSARQWAEARAKSPDDFEEEENREAGAAEPKGKGSAAQPKPERPGKKDEGLGRA